MNRIILLLIVVVLTSCKERTSKSRVLDAQTQMQRGTINVEVGTGRWGFTPADGGDAMSVHMPIEYRGVMSNCIGKTIEARFLRLERSVEGVGGNIVLVDFVDARP